MMHMWTSCISTCIYENAASKVHIGMQGSFDLDEESWGGISLEVKQLIKRLLSVDPLCRPSATEVCLA